MKKERTQAQVEKDRVRDRQYYQSHREQRLEYARLWRDRNREKIRQDNARYYKERRTQHQSSQLKYQARRRKTDPSFRIACNLRSRIGSFLKYKGHQKDSSVTRSLGCSKEELKEHLESRFSDGMSWENYGRTGWHIDHIIPLCELDLTKTDELAKACHYTNLQPLWAVDNLAKRFKDEHGESKTNPRG